MALFSDNSASKSYFSPSQVIRLCRLWGWKSYFYIIVILTELLFTHWYFKTPVFEVFSSSFRRLQAITSNYKRLQLNQFFIFIRLRILIGWERLKPLKPLKRLRASESLWEPIKPLKSLKISENLWSRVSCVPLCGSYAIDIWLLVFPCPHGDYDSITKQQ